MGKFLDQTGLNYLWSKLKTKLDDKVSKSGDTMTGDFKIQKTVPEFSLNSGNGRTRIFKNANADADYGSSFGDILADEKTSVYLELHADSELAGAAKLKKIDAQGGAKEYKLFHEGNLDTTAAIPKYVAVTLPAASWAGNTQNATVSGVLADETAQLIQPVPAIASQAAYIDAGVRCIGQAMNQITFTCSQVPATDLMVYVVITSLTDTAPAAEIQTVTGTTNAQVTIEYSSLADTGEIVTKKASNVNDDKIVKGSILIAYNPVQSVQGGATQLYESGNTSVYKVTGDFSLTSTSGGGGID